MDKTDAAFLATQIASGQVSSAKTKYDLFLNEIASPVVGPNVACRNTVHELPVRLTSLYIRIPKTPRTEPGKNDLHYCQRTTASGDCRLRPAGAERSCLETRYSVGL